jgi:NAD(P)H-dependent flavin oxidoreductase YrpB (nitropropane dioxygenase family)
LYEIAVIKSHCLAGIQLCVKAACKHKTYPANDFIMKCKIAGGKLHSCKYPGKNFTFKKTVAILRENMQRL